MKKDYEKTLLEALNNNGDYVVLDLMVLLYNMDLIVEKVVKIVELLENKGNENESN